MNIRYVFSTAVLLASVGLIILFSQNRVPKQRLTLIMMFGGEGDPRCAIDAFQQSGYAFDVQLYYHAGFRLSEEHQRQGFHQSSLVSTFTDVNFTSPFVIWRQAASISQSDVLLFIEPEVKPTAEWVRDAASKVASGIGLVGCQVSRNGQPFYGYQVNSKDLRFTRLSHPHPDLRDDLYIPLEKCVAVNRESALVAFQSLPPLMPTTLVARLLVAGFAEVPLTRDGLLDIVKIRLMIAEKVVTEAVSAVEMADLSSPAIRQIVFHATTTTMNAQLKIEGFDRHTKAAYASLNNDAASVIKNEMRRYAFERSSDRIERVRAATQILTNLFFLLDTAVICEPEELMLVSVASLGQSTSFLDAVVALPLLDMQSSGMQARFEKSFQRQYLDSEKLNVEIPWLTSSIGKLLSHQTEKTLRLDQVPRTLYYVDLEPTPTEKPSLARRLVLQQHRLWMTSQPGFASRVLRNADCVDLAQRFRRVAHVYQRLPLRVAKVHLCRLLYAFFEGGFYAGPGSMVGGAFASDWALRSTDFVVFTAPDGKLLSPAVVLGSTRGNTCVRAALVAAVDSYAQNLIDGIKSEHSLKLALSGSLDGSILSSCITRESRKSLPFPVSSIVWPPTHVDLEWREELAEAGLLPIPPRIFFQVDALDVPPSATQSLMRSDWAMELGYSWEFEYFTRNACVTAAIDHKWLALADAISTNRSTKQVRELRLACAALACFSKGGLTIHWSLSPGPATEDVHPGSHVAIVGVTQNGHPTPKFFGCRPGQPDVGTMLHEANFQFASGDGAFVSVAALTILHLWNKPTIMIVSGIERKLVKFPNRTPSSSWDDEQLSKIPHRILWVSARHLPARAVKNAAQWLGSNEVETYLMTDSDCLRLAKQRGSKSESLFRGLSGPSRGEYCRLVALHKFGGLVLDVDVTLLVSVAELLAVPDTALFFAVNSEAAVSRRFVTWIAAAVPQHPLVTRVLAHYEQTGDVGERAFQNAIKGINVESLAGIGHLDNTGIAHHDVASKNWIADHDYESTLTLMQTRAFKKAWPVCVAFAAVPPFYLTNSILGSIHGVRSEGIHLDVVSTHECFMAARSVARVDTAWGYFISLPLNFQSVFCGAARIAAGESKTGFVLDLRYVVTGHLATALQVSEGGGTAFMPVAEGGISPLVVGLQRECASQLVRSLESRVEETVVKSTFNQHPEAYFASAEGLSGLGVSPLEFESLLHSIPKCVVGMRTIDELGFLNHTRVASLRGQVRFPLQRFIIIPHSQPPYAFKSAEKKFRADNPEVKTLFKSVSECKADATSFLLDGIEQIFDEATFQLQKMFCELLYLFRDGGFVTEPETISRVPMSLWLESESDFLSSTRDGKRSHTFVAAVQNHECVREALETLLRLLRDLSGIDVTQKRRSEEAKIIDRFSELLMNCPPTNVPIELTAGFGFEASAHPPLNVKPHIPRRLVTLWKSKDLFDEAAEVQRRWLIEEPEIEHQIITDPECRLLAARFPGFLQMYDAFPLNVMRADACRVLAIFYHGGIYRDLDVAWARPLDEWFDFGADLVVGNETEGRVVHLCNWFFAAVPQHPCLRSVLEQIQQDWTSRRPKIFDTEHFVHDITGPATFTRGLLRCDARAKHSRAEMTRDNVYHHYGSQMWRDNPTYESWITAREVVRQQHQTPPVEK